MSEVTCIGKCIGCDRMRKIRTDVSEKGGICADCLDSPSRGTKWAERAYRCRTDSEYARATYDRIDSARGKKLYIMMFGLPDGAAPPAPENPVPTGTFR